jgi:hypothetical protein
MRSVPSIYAGLGSNEPNILRLKKHLSLLKTKSLSLKKENRRGSPTAEDYHLFKFLKDEIRYHHLALNFITDRAYKSAEPNCESVPQINKLFPIILAYEPIFRPYSKFEIREAQILSETELYKELQRWLAL